MIENILFILRHAVMIVTSWLIIIWFGIHHAPYKRNIAECFNEIIFLQSESIINKNEVSESEIELESKLQEEEEVNQYGVLWIEQIINRKWCINYSQHRSCWRERNNQSVYRSWVHDLILILRSCISLINELLHVLNKQLRFNYFFLNYFPQSPFLQNILSFYSRFFWCVFIEFHKYL